LFLTEKKQQKNVWSIFALSTYTTTRKRV